LPGFETCGLDLKFAACPDPLFFDDGESTGFVNDAATEGIVVNKTKFIKPFARICGPGHAQYEGVFVMGVWQEPSSFSTSDMILEEDFRILLGAVECDV
jgi:hypothetical protein